MLEFSTYLPSLIDHIVAGIPFFKPELALIVTFITTILASLFMDRYWKNCSFLLTLLGLSVSICYLLGQHVSQVAAGGFFDMIQLDTFAIRARIMIGITTFIVAILIHQTARHRTKGIADLYSVLITATLGLYLLTLSSNWLMIFLAVETVSISSYVLVGYFSGTKVHSEAAMKYVLFGSACAAVMLYGLSLLYGFTGNLNFDSQSHINGLIEAPRVMVSLALLFLLAGIGFKLSFFPFHVWSPDVYQGAPTAITAYLSTVPKIAVITLLSKLLAAWAPLSFYFSDFLVLVLTIAAVATMLVGNLAALRQQDAKRLMAYSSIGHTGLLLMAALVYQAGESSVLLFYLAVYALMNIAVFLFIALLEQSTGNSRIDAYRGLGKKYPVLFASFSVVLISLTGLPPTGGFIGKLLVFSKVFEQFQLFQSVPLLLLLVVGALTSVISLFYYFKIPLYAFLRDSENIGQDDFHFSRLLLGMGVAISIILLLLGIFPDLLLGLFM